jgi:GNAT superfamily N-acetyltransferase
VHLLVTALDEHAAVSSAFVVDRILEVTLVDGGLGGMSLTETAVTDPYVKDYDAIEGEGPAPWPGRFDISNWGLICARRDGTKVGGAVIAFDTPGLHMLGGSDNAAVLWDIRVSPGARGTGIGSALFRAAGDWACTHGRRWLKIETQNINAAACTSTRKWGAPWAPSTGSPIPGCPARSSCCGGRRWRRAAKPNPADLSLKPPPRPFHTGRETTKHSRPPSGRLPLCRFGRVWPTLTAWCSPVGRSACATTGKSGNGLAASFDGLDD